MKKITVAVMGLFVAGGALAAPDWDKVPPRKMTLFYPGQASYEWVMNKADHSAVPDIVTVLMPSTVKVTVAFAMPLRLAVTVALSAAGAPDSVTSTVT